MTYPEFKAVVDSKKIRPQCLDSAAKYELCAYDDQIRYDCEVYRQDPGAIGFDWATHQGWLADFEANMLPLCNRSLQTSPVSALSKFHKGKIELAAEDTSGYCEWSFDADVEINKVRPKPISAEFGDYVTMEVWAKGETPFKVEDFGTGIYVCGGDGNTGEWYEGSGGGKIPATCTVRCYYHKVAGTARKFLIDAEFLE